MTQHNLWECGTQKAVYTAWEEGCGSWSREIWNTLLSFSLPLPRGAKSHRKCNVDLESWCNILMTIREIISNTNNGIQQQKYIVRESEDEVFFYFNLLYVSILVPPSLSSTFSYKSFSQRGNPHCGCHSHTSTLPLPHTHTRCHCGTRHILSLWGQKRWSI